MKKIILLTAIGLMGISILDAQTFAEWFRQKKTQIQYLEQQIAALQVYAGYLEKGYHIAQAGLTTIGEIKNGEFSLHQTFFSSLSQINPAIGADVRVAEIIALQISIIEKYKNCYQQVQQSHLFNSGEVSTVYAVFSKLLEDCANDISALISLTKMGDLQLSDAERIKRIQSLDLDMKDKYRFTQSFSNQTIGMAFNRMQEQNEAAMMKTIYQLK